MCVFYNASPHPPSQSEQALNFSSVFLAPWLVVPMRTERSWPQTWWPLPYARVFCAVHMYELTANCPKSKGRKDAAENAAIQLPAENGGLATQKSWRRSLLEKGSLCTNCTPPPKLVHQNRPFTVSSHIYHMENQRKAKFNGDAMTDSAHTTILAMPRRASINK